MKKSHLYTAWGVLFLLTAVLGFIPAPEGALRGLLTLLSLAFFLPPLLLIRQGERALIRWLSIGSLGLTVAVLILNFLSIAGSEALGQLLYAFLVVVSAPMVCSGHWAFSMFCWACLLFATLVKRNAR